MERLRKRGDRVLLSVMTAMLVTSLTIGIPSCPNRNVMAWWGSIYPQFCFSKWDETDEKGAKDEETVQEHRPKISFWLAKALDRW